MEKMAMKNMPMDMAFAQHVERSERSFARINLVLKKHGLMDEDPEDPEAGIEKLIPQGNLILSEGTLTHKKYSRWY